MAKDCDPAADPGVFARILRTFVRLACLQPWPMLSFTLLSCLFCVYYSFRTLKCETHRNDLIGKNHDYYKRWQQYVREFGDDDDLVVIAKGDDSAKLIEAIEAAAAKINAKPDLFDRVFYKVDLRHLRDRALLYLPAPQIRKIQEHLQSYDMTMLLEAPFHFGWKSLSLQQILEKAKAQAQSFGVDRPLGDLDGLFEQVNAICKAADASLGDASQYRNPWVRSVPAGDPAQEKQLSEPRYFLNENGTLAFLLCRVAKTDDDYTAARTAIEAMRAILDELGKDRSNVEFGLTGLPVLENDEMLASNDDSTRASWLALVGVMVLYFVVYRGFRYPMMTILALVVGTVWALGWLTFTVGHLNILSSTFAVMLIGIGDYGVLWVTRYQQERRNGLDQIPAMEATALHVGPSIFTAAVTTAISFYAAMLADLKAVAELGWIAGSGVILCAISCFLVTPPLLMVFEPKLAARMEGAPLLISLEQHRRNRRAWLEALMRHPGSVVGFAVFASVVLGHFALGLHYDHNLLNLQAQNLPSVQWERKLIDEMAGSSWQALSTTTTPEEALALKARYEQLPDVAHVVEVASLIPREQERKLEMVADICRRLSKLPKPGVRLEHAAPSLRLVEKTASQLFEALAPLEAKASAHGLRVTLARLLPKLRKALGSPSEPAVVGLLQSLDECLARDLADDLLLLRKVATPKAITLEDVPQVLRDRYVSPSGRWLVRVFGKDSLWEFEPLLAFVRSVQTVDREATGKPFTTLEGLIAMRDGFLWAGVYAFIAMLIVLLVDFGSVKYTMLALLPLGMGIVGTLGVLALAGVPLNPANMIAFPLILGVGADNGVHVLHDYRERDRSKAYRLDLATGRGILVASLTTILGFGTLVISQHRGMASLGLALAIGVSCCTATALVFLPALLGWNTQRRLAREQGRVILQTKQVVETPAEKVAA